MLTWETDNPSHLIMVALLGNNLLFNQVYSGAYVTKADTTDTCRAYYL